MHFGKSLLAILSLSSILNFKCETPTDYDVSINQGNTGDITGTIVYDSEGDGTYSPTWGDVCIDKKMGAMPISESNCEYYMETNNSGVFGFYGVPIGVHNLSIQRYWDYPSHQTIHKYEGSVVVNRDQITNMGNVELGCYYHYDGCP